MVEIAATLDYVASLAPLVIGHFIFRPLHSEGLLPFSIPITGDLANGLPYRPRANTMATRPWTIFTYMMVHTDDHHLIGNLTALAMYARSVYGEGGSLLVYPIFIFGGAFAALDPFNLKAYQWSLQNQNAIKFKTEETKLGKWWNKGAEKISVWIAPKMIGTKRYVGSSGGVAALFGASTILVGVDLIVFCKDWRKRGNAVFKEPDFFKLLIGVLNSSSYMWSEYQRLSQGVPSGIDHAGHISGLAFGVLAMSIYQATKFAFPTQQSRLRD